MQDTAARAVCGIFSVVKIDTRIVIHEVERSAGIAAAVRDMDLALAAEKIRDLTVRPAV